MTGLVFYSEWNPWVVPMWMRAAEIVAVVGIVVLLFLINGMRAFTAAGRSRQQVRQARQVAYEQRRAARAGRRHEDLLWAVLREHAYERAVDIRLERVGGDVAVLLARAARSERTRAHLRVVA